MLPNEPMLGTKMVLDFYLQISSIGKEAPQMQQWMP